MQAVIGEHTYEFEDKISEESRETFAESQEKLCSILEKHGISTAGFTFRILADYPNRTESENGVAYYGLDSINTWGQVLTTIQVCYGDYTNYGYLYALANQVAADLKWNCDEVSVGSADAFVADTSLLNLVYPCFSEKYSDTEVIIACKALAIELLATTEDIWSEAEFLEARAIYAQDKSIDFEPTYVTFAYNGESCPLKLSCQYLEVFWDYTFIASNEYLNGIIPVDYTDGVSGLIHTFEWLDAQLTMLCNRLNVEPVERVPVQMTEALPKGYLSPYVKTGGLYHYENGAGEIFATTVTALAHEYVHHIYYLLCQCEDPAYERWCNEVVAYYYTVGQAYEYRLNIIKNVDPSYRERLEARLGEAYDDPSDYIKFMRIGWRENEREYVYYLKSDNSLCSAFGEYFVRTYGEDVFLNSMLYPSQVKTFTGKTMDEIVDDWCLDMQNPAND